MNRVIRNVLIGVLVAVLAEALLLMFDVALAQVVQSWILDTYGGSVVVAELYLFAGELLACAIPAIIAVIAGKDSRVRVAGIAVVGIAVTVVTWIGVNYVIVAIFNAADLVHVNITDYWLVQAYGAAFAFPGGVVYFWMAVTFTYAIWFTGLLLTFGGIEPRVRFQLAHVDRPEYQLARRKPPKYKLSRVERQEYKLARARKQAYTLARKERQEYKLAQVEQPGLAEQRRRQWFTTFTVGVIAVSTTLIIAGCLSLVSYWVLIGCEIGLKVGCSILTGIGVHEFGPWWEGNPLWRRLFFRFNPTAVIAWVFIASHALWVFLLLIWPDATLMRETDWIVRNFHLVLGVEILILATVNFVWDTSKFYPARQRLRAWQALERAELRRLERASRKLYEQSRH